MRSMSSVCRNRFAPRHILAIFLTSLNLPSFDFLPLSATPALQAHCPMATFGFLSLPLNRNPLVLCHKTCMHQSQVLIWSNHNSVPPGERRCQQSVALTALPSTNGFGYFISSQIQIASHSH
jgi:hypothetical protein